MIERHFCLAVYGYKKCCPIHTTPYTRDNAERARRVQQGPHNYHVVTAHPTLRGTFVSVETGAHFEATQQAYTKDAWESFLDRMWPAT
ncbi:hypothetical protein [Mesorhizobium sp. M0843]|uniref:hypothetical protein n=1 Tax=Mesorhizobium sp. M0843 TaxID=2957010 RepID=UPI003338A25F